MFNDDYDFPHFNIDEDESYRYVNYDRSVLAEISPRKHTIKKTILNPFTLNEITKGHTEPNDVYCTDQIVQKLNDDKVTNDIANIAENTYFKYVFSDCEREYVEVFPGKISLEIEPFIVNDINPFHGRFKEPMYTTSFREIKGEIVDGCFKYEFSSEDGEIITSINDVKSEEDLIKTYSNAQLYIDSYLIAEIDNVGGENTFVDFSEVIFPATNTRVIRVMIKPTMPFSVTPKLLVERKTIANYDAIKSNPQDPSFPYRTKYLFDSLFENFGNEQIVPRCKRFKFTADLGANNTVVRYALPGISAIADITVYVEHKTHNESAYTFPVDADAWNNLRLNWLRYSPDIDNADVTNYCPKAQSYSPPTLTEQYLIVKFPFCRSTIKSKYERRDNFQRKVFGGADCNLVRGDTFGLFGIAKYNNGIEIELSVAQPQQYTLLVYVNYFDVICRYKNAMFYKFCH